MDFDKIIKQELGGLLTGETEDIIQPEKKIKVQIRDHKVKEETKEVIIKKKEF